jgi:hypothetical protein
MSFAVASGERHERIKPAVACSSLVSLFSAFAVRSAPIQAAI